MNEITQLIDPSEIEEIRDLHEGICHIGRKALADALQVGEKLAGIKSRLKHREWTPWVENNLCFDIRTVQKYMRLYNEREALKNEQISFLKDADRLIREKKERRKLRQELSPNGGSDRGSEVDYNHCPSSPSQADERLGGTNTTPEEKKSNDDSQEQELGTPPEQTPESGPQDQMSSEKEGPVRRNDHNVMDLGTGSDDTKTTALKPQLRSCLMEMLTVYEGLEYGGHFSKTNFETFLRGLRHLNQACRSLGIDGPPALCLAAKPKNRKREALSEHKTVAGVSGALPVVDDPKGRTAPDSGPKAQINQ